MIVKIFLEHDVIIFPSMGKGKLEVFKDVILFSRFFFLLPSSYRYTQRYVIGRAVQKYPARHRQTNASDTVHPHAQDHSRPGQ